MGFYKPCHDFPKSCAAAWRHEIFSITDKRLCGPER